MKRGTESEPVPGVTLVRHHVETPAAWQALVGLLVDLLDAPEQPRNLMRIPQRQPSPRTI